MMLSGKFVQPAVGTANLTLLFSMGWMDGLHANWPEVGTAKHVHITITLYLTLSLPFDFLDDIF